MHVYSKLAFFTNCRLYTVQVIGHCYCAIIALPVTVADINAR